MKVSIDKMIGKLEFLSLIFFFQEMIHNCLDFHFQDKLAALHVFKMKHFALAMIKQCAFVIYLFIAVLMQVLKIHNKI